MSDQPDTAKDFIRQMIAADVAAGKHGGRVQTRFPPEPNGYLQIGHAKAICLNFEIAQAFGGRCNLRFDDTNPEKESDEFVQAIQEDIRWLGYQWDQLCFASDYFEQLFNWACQLIESGDAYVDDLSFEEMRAYRGNLPEPGRDSPSRTRPVAESLDLFHRMRAGEFADGAKVLRAKIDMAHPNMNMRDPVLYRIKRMHHHRVGDQWCIYPSYDFTHGQSDSLEEVTHSLCSLEFEDHRPLYDWFIQKLGIFPSQQTEFARLNLTYTVVSKRKLRALVEGGQVTGWDDPRMPTLRGMRRRGYPAAAIRNFCAKVGVTKVPSTSDVALLEHAVREELNRVAPRRMAVLDPIEIEITNWQGAETQWVDAINNPEDASAGSRSVPFSQRLYIERDDFKEDGNRKFFRLKPGGEVRLRGAYIVRCDQVIKDEEGQVTKLQCAVDWDTLNKNPTDRKVKGVIHWVSASRGVRAEVRRYDRLFNDPNPGKSDDVLAVLNPDSLRVIDTAVLEPSLAHAQPEQVFQFEREGYFIADRFDHGSDKPVFNMTIGLRDTWSAGNA